MGKAEAHIKLELKKRRIRKIIDYKYPIWIFPLFLRIFMGFVELSPYKFEKYSPSTYFRKKINLKIVQEVNRTNTRKP